MTFSSGVPTVGSRISGRFTGVFEEAGALTKFEPADYTLEIDPVPSVTCPPERAGREGEFSADPLSYGFSEGPVTVTATTPGSFLLSGAAISSPFGIDPLEVGFHRSEMIGHLEPRHWLNGGEEGPANTIGAGRFISLDALTATSTSIVGRMQAGFVPREVEYADYAWQWCVVSYRIWLAR